MALIKHSSGGVAMLKLWDIVCWDFGSFVSGFLSNLWYSSSSMTAGIGLFFSPHKVMNENWKKLFPRQLLVLLWILIFWHHFCFRNWEEMDNTKATVLYFWAMITHFFSKQLLVHWFYGKRQVPSVQQCAIHLRIFEGRSAFYKWPTVVGIVWSFT